MWSVLTIFASVLSFCQGNGHAGDFLFDQELYHRVLDAERCAHQLQAMNAYDFYECSFRVPQGLLIGNLVNYGNFYQCLAINQQFPDGNVVGKYCVVHAELTIPIVRIPSLSGISDNSNITWTEWDSKRYLNTMLEKSVSVATEPRTLRLAVCVPRPCRADALLKPYADHPHVRFNYSEQFCRLPGDKPYLGADYAVIIIFMLFGLLTVASTSYDLYYTYVLKKDPATANELLRSFSIYTNMDRLLTFSSRPGALEHLEGVRALSMLWIVIHHTLKMSVTWNSFNKLDMIESVSPLWIWKGEIAVDVFFVLSGLLLVYSTASKNKQFTCKRLLLFYLNRYVRLFPVLATTILLQAAALRRLLNSPEEFYRINQVINCREYWWSALMYIQNIVNGNNCMYFAWYLTMDTQLHAVSPVLLYWVLRGHRSAWVALGTAVVTSLAASFAVCCYHNFPFADITLSQPGYFNIIIRAPVFFIGMLLGYTLHIYRAEKLKLSKITVIVCYWLAALILLLAIYIEHPIFEGLWEHQIAVNLKYTFYRPIWSLAVCWLIIACGNGYGGPVNWFLTRKVWKFFSRISYAIYMTGSVLQYVPYGAGVMDYFYMQTLLWRFAGDAFWAVTLSVAISVIIEAPIFILYKLALEYKRPTTNNNTINYKTTDKNTTKENITKETTTNKDTDNENITNTDLQLSDKNETVKKVP